MKVSVSKPSDPNPALKCHFCGRNRRFVWCLFLPDYESEMPGSRPSYICDLCIRSARDFERHKQFVRTTDVCNFCNANQSTVAYMIEGPSRTRICSECIADAKMYLGGTPQRTTGNFPLPRP